jgi:hypothetical protein
MFSISYALSWMISPSLIVISSSLVMVLLTGTVGLMQTGGAGIYVISKSVGLHRVMSMSNKMISSSGILKNN